MQKSPHITIVIPTYNEKDSLTELVEHIHALGIENLHMVVVDDDSPDGTGALADTLSQKFPLSVIHRPTKEGLGNAYTHAFHEILKSSPDNSAIIIQMDADLSHNPSDIPRFLERIQTCDIVLGSRYIPGGGVENWDIVRRLISRFGNTYASFVLGLPYRDVTSGYKCFRPEVLQEIDLSSVSSTGYNFQIETTYLAHKKWFRIREIPILFTERKFGKSKFHIGIMLESFWKVLLLRFKNRNNSKFT